MTTELGRHNRYQLHLTSPCGYVETTWFSNRKRALVYAKALATRISENAGFALVDAYRGETLLAKQAA